MRFLNEKQLIEGGSGVYMKLRRDALAILGSAIDAVDPKKAIYARVRIDGDKLHVDGHTYDLKRTGKILLIGGGKAGGPMAEAVEYILGDRLTDGIVNVLKGTESKYRLKHVKLVGASHPVPDEAGVHGVSEMLNAVKKLTSDDLVIVLISGGGSALMPCPAKGITLNDLQSITGKLLKRGATINDLNAVRKHLDAFKGGQLAERCQPAEVLSLILSDVIGDPLDTIASGPTAPDSTTWADAEVILKKYDAWDEAPAAVRSRIQEGVVGKISDTPKADSPVFARTRNIIVANNSHAAEAALKKASELGYNSMVLSTMIEGEARHVGTVYAGIAREVANRGRPVKAPAAIIVGGETTVDVKGSGKGGRNQEVALSAARRIAGESCLIASLATDGLDGPTDSAGALVDGNTASNVTRLGLSIDSALRENDAYPFLKNIGGLLMTGPTGTNVNDLALILVAGK